MLNYHWVLLKPHTDFFFSHLHLSTTESCHIFSHFPLVTSRSFSQPNIVFFRMYQNKTVICVEGRGLHRNLRSISCQWSSAVNLQQIVTRYCDIFPIFTQVISKSSLKTLQKAIKILIIHNRPSQFHEKNCEAFARTDSERKRKPTI